MYSLWFPEKNAGRHAQINLKMIVIKILITVAGCHIDFHVIDGEKGSAILRERQQ